MAQYMETPPMPTKFILLLHLGLYITYMGSYGPGISTDLYQV